MILASLVQELIEFPEHLEADYETAIPSDVRMVELLVAIRDCRAGLATFADRVEKDLLATMGEKSMVVDGVGLVEAKRSTRRTKWDHAALVSAIVSRLADEPGVFYGEDGTLLPYGQIGQNVAARLRECVSFGAGKVTGLRAIGITPDEYCEEDEAVWSVKIPGGQL